MPAAGIIAEYNPFHNGHLFHLQKTKEILQLPVIAVISSSFMQRGEPSILSKWKRAEICVGCGADLVLELPVSYSLGSAEYFARGATDILQATRCVNHISCGCENPKLDFSALARRITSAKYQHDIKELLQQGHSYAAAHAQLLGDGFDRPNNILALEYTKALLGSDISMLYIKRNDNGYNSPLLAGATASASAIRRDLQSGGMSWTAAVPSSTRTALETCTPCNTELLWHLLSYRLRCLSPLEIAERTTASEGLEHTLKRAADCSSWEEAVKFCTNKRYPSSRIRRLLLQLLLDVPKANFGYRKPAYLRVLAFNDKGRNLLKEISVQAAVPVITKLGKNPCAGQSAAFAEQLTLETKAMDLWALLHGLPSALDRTTSPIYLK